MHYQPFTLPPSASRPQLPDQSHTALAARTKAAVTSPTSRACPLAFVARGEQRGSTPRKPCSAHAAVRWAQAMDPAAGPAARAAARMPPQRGHSPTAARRRRSRTHHARQRRALLAAQADRSLRQSRCTRPGRRHGGSAVAASAIPARGQAGCLATADARIQGSAPIRVAEPDAPRRARPGAPKWSSAATDRCVAARRAPFAAAPGAQPSLVRIEQQRLRRAAVDQAWWAATAPPAGAARGPCPRR